MWIAKNQKINQGKAHEIQTNSFWRKQHDLKLSPENSSPVLSCWSWLQLLYVKTTCSSTTRAIGNTRATWVHNSDWLTNSGLWAHWLGGVTNRQASSSGLAAARAAARVASVVSLRSGRHEAANLHGLARDAVCGRWQVTKSKDFVIVLRQICLFFLLFQSQIWYQSIKNEMSVWYPAVFKHRQYYWEQIKKNTKQNITFASFYDE